MPVNRERANRGGKPLISVGVNYEGAPIVDSCCDGVHPPAAMKLFNFDIPNQLMANFPIIWQV
jgi:hypothetical protein